MTFAWKRGAAVTVCCVAMLQGCEGGGGGSNEQVAQPSGQSEAGLAFQNLLTTLAYGDRLTLVSAMTANPETGTMYAPALVCRQGSVSEVSLNGVAVTGGEALSSPNPDLLHTRFQGCSGKLDPGEVAEADDPVLTGVAEVNFSSSFGDTRTTILVDATLTQLRDTAVAVQGSGRYVAAYDEAQSGNTVTTTMSWRPQAGSTLTHTSTGRTLSFVSGSYGFVNTDDSAGNALGQTLTVSKLTYTLNGATYVLDGKVVNSKGQITLSKNGAVTATLSTDGASTTVTGTVDPF